MSGDTAGKRYSFVDTREEEVETKRVKGYPFDPVKQKEELVLKTYEYDMPFNYSNVTVWRNNYHGSEFHGVELFPQNESTPKAGLTKVEPGSWTLMQAMTITIHSAPSGQL